MAKNAKQYYGRKDKDEFIKKYDLSEQLMILISWIEKGDLDRAHRYLLVEGSEKMLGKEVYFAYSLLFAARKDIDKYLENVAKSMGKGMPKAVFSTGFSTFFEPLIYHGDFINL